MRIQVIKDMIIFLKYSCYLGFILGLIRKLNKYFEMNNNNIFKELLAIVLSILFIILNCEIVTFILIKMIVRMSSIYNNLIQ
jgi:hypothetical protein